VRTSGLSCAGQHDGLARLWCWCLAANRQCRRTLWPHAEKQGEKVRAGLMRPICSHAQLAHFCALSVRTCSLFKCAFSCAAALRTVRTQPAHSLHTAKQEWPRNPFCTMPPPPTSAPPPQAAKKIHHQEKAQTARKRRPKRHPKSTRKAPTPRPLAASGRGSKCSKHSGGG